ncbi:uncharacterized protein LOC129748434 [Uranotaenia lowii]|uniref:uncharacterized protein LOC129748434 n=1 Tax=Uranotaenia lowii TaxID=190385 RepID=UPI002478B0E7|nr:uncharacterized protein LOC129748434 [Uranotaenia lowii]
MKLFLILLGFLLSTCYADYSKAQIKIIFDTAKVCIEELNIPDDIVERSMYNRDITEKDMPFVVCMMKKMNMIDAQENYLVSNMVDFMAMNYDRAVQQRIMSKCTKQEGTLLERTWKLYQCYFTDKELKL